MNTTNWPTGYNTRLINITQGEFEVSKDPGIVISTILGSCISVCLFDDVSGVGGMNHYLLADGGSENKSDLKYGAHSIELLINRLIRTGASRDQIKGKIFGGSAMSAKFSAIGSKNASFAIDYMSREGFAVLAKDIGGTSARRVNFHPVTGQARVTHTDQAVESTKIPDKPTSPKAHRDVTLF